MNSKPIPGWNEVVVPGKTPAARLHMRYRPDTGDWSTWAPAYWEGRLPGLREISSSRHARVECAELPDDGPPCYFKRYFLRDWRDVLKHLFRPARARRALLAGEQVAALGFQVPPPLCLIEERRLGRTRASALITAAVENAPDVRAWLNRPELGLAGNRDRKRAFLRAFARDVGAWHKAGLYHGDMRLGNILARERDGDFTFVWLDNERTRRYARLPDSRRIRNLMQVNMETRG
ncbi:MAG: hypothetical protein JXB04_13030, partial [Kiritimatiellae bacterium]|nr:hypothetical protein [Kiritimatiellia bacterium]